MLFERTGLEDPAQLEIPGILRADLRQRTMALAVETTGIRQPILRLVIGAQDPLERNGFHGRFTA